MSFSYNFDAAPAIAYVRLLIPDTVQDAAKQLPVFSDEEINAFYTIQGSQFQSSMFYSPPQSRAIPSTPLSYLRVAALALDTMANNAAVASLITQLMDIKMSAKDAAAMLAARANQYRQTDDESGAFAVIEQVTTVWGFQQRWWNQISRLQGGGGIA